MFKKLFCVHNWMPGYDGRTVLICQKCGKSKPYNTTQDAAIPKSKFKGDKK